MPRFVLVSDLHLDWVSSGVHRFEEVAAAVDETVKAAIQKRADAWLFLGDAMNPDSGSCVFRCVEVLVRAAGRLNVGKIPSFFLSGNHDTIEDGRGDTTLSPLRSVPGATVIEQPMVVRIGDHDLLGLPFTATSRAYDPASFVRKTCSGDRPLVAISHLHVRGVAPGSESKELARGREVWLPDEELLEVSRRRPTMVFNGHIHRAQEHACPSGLMVRIPGSVCRLTHGEEQNQPSFLVVDLP